MSCSLSKKQIDRTIAFHGHWCPGLAVGIRAAEWALIEIGKASDEQIVAVVETDMCAVDAIQFLTGCTFGKGNLIHQDYGKNAFAFYRRRDGKAVRLVARADTFQESREAMRRLNQKRQSQGLTADEQNAWDAAREKLSSQIMTADFSELFAIKEPALPVPEKARILASRICESCGEAVMETRIRKYGQKRLCIPCIEAVQGKTAAAS